MHLNPLLPPPKLQICLLLADKSQTSVVRVLDMLENCIGKELFKRLFGIILTDNGSESANYELIERSVFGSIFNSARRFWKYLILDASTSTGNTVALPSTKNSISCFESLSIQYLRGMFLFVFRRHFFDYLG